MLKKLYVSPEFEWIYIDLLEDVLSSSLDPDVEVDPNPMDPDPGEGEGGDGELGGDGEDVGGIPGL